MVSVPGRKGDGLTMLRWLFLRLWPLSNYEQDILYAALADTGRIRLTAAGRYEHGPLANPRDSDRQAQLQEAAEYRDAFYRLFERDCFDRCGDICHLSGRGFRWAEIVRRARTRAERETA